MWTCSCCYNYFSSHESCLRRDSRHLHGRRRRDGKKRKMHLGGHPTEDHPDWCIKYIFWGAACGGAACHAQASTCELQEARNLGPQLLSTPSLSPATTPPPKLVAPAPSSHLLLRAPELRHHGQPNPRRCHGQVSAVPFPHPNPASVRDEARGGHSQWCPLLTTICAQRHGVLEAGYAIECCWVTFQLALLTYAPLGFAGNDSPSFVFPTAIATKGPAQAAGGGTGSGRPGVANKPSFLTGGAGPGGHLSMKRGTEDLDFFIGDEAIAASSGPGELGSVRVLAESSADGARLRSTLPDPTRPNRELGWSECLWGEVWR